MSSYLDNYIQRSQAYGNGFSGTIGSSTTQIINDKFKDSPFYASVPINGTNTDVRIVTEDDKLADVKVLLFRPNTVVNRGSIATINGYKWMLVDYFDNAIFPKSTINRCNELVKWKDKNNITYQYDCVVKIVSDRSVSMKTDKIFDIPFNKFIVYVPYNNDTKTIQMSQRFLLKQSAYKVIGKDDNSKVFNGNGYIELIMELTESNPADDFVNQIADNSIIYGGSSTGSTTNQGGGLW